MGGYDLLKRKRSEVVHRPRKDVKSKVREEIVERSSMESDSGVLTHQRQHYSVYYTSSINDLQNERITDQKSGQCI